MRILTELMRDSRVSVTRLAKELGISREVATYRMNKMRDDGVILNYVTEIDLAKLGYLGAAVFVNVKATGQTKFRKFLDDCPFVSWVAELSGIWSFGFSIYGKSPADLDKKFLTIIEAFKMDLIDNRFSLHRRSLFFYEKYFGAAPAKTMKKQLIRYDIDEKDRRILKELALNSRISSVALAEKVSLTAPAVAQRINQLERSGFITRYSIFVDITKLGLFQYSVFVINKNLDKKPGLLDYLRAHPAVPYIAEYVGDPFLEFGIAVKNPYELRTLLQGIEEIFPDHRVIEVSLFHHELASVGPPACVFE